MTPASTLPALDKKKIFLFLGCGLFGAALGYFGATFVEGYLAPDGAPLPMAYRFFLLLWLPLAVLLTVAVHELGHVVAGLLQGFTFKSYTVACFHLYKEDGRLRFRLVLNNLKGFLGLALCLPPAGLRREDLTRRFACYALGGPVSNLILALLLLVPYFLGWDEITSATPLAYTLAGFAAVSGWISLLLFVLNIIPTKSNGLYTDGARAMNMLRGGNEAFLDSAILTVLASSTGGNPPETLDEELLQEAASLPVDSVFIHYCHAYLYLMHLQRGNATQAKHHLQLYASGVARMPAIARGSVWLEQAYFEAMHEDNLALARQHYAKAVPSPFISKDMFLRAEAAIALREGRWSEANDLAKQALSQLPNNTDKGAARAYHAWLIQIQEEAKLEGVKCQAAAQLV